MKRKAFDLMLMSLAMMASSGIKNDIFDISNPTDIINKHKSPKLVCGTNVVGRRHFSKKKRKLLNSKKK